MKIVQCILSSPMGGNDGYKATMIAWLDVHPKLKEGCYVTLKDSEDPTRLWHVDYLGGRIEEKADVVIKTRGAFFGRDKHRKNGGWVDCK